MESVRLLRRHGALICISSLALAAALSRFVGQRTYQSTFADDFYYYLAIADSFAQGHGSAFFGTPTNGYHPLWMLGLALLVRLFGTGPVGFLAISLTIAGLLVVMFAILASAGVNLGARRSAAQTASLFATTVALPVAHIGLETQLTLVALSGAIWWLSDWLRRPLSPVRYAVGGLLVSLSVLARSDSVAVLGVAFLVCAAFLYARGRLRGGNWSAGMFALGLTPVGAYLVMNRVFYGTSVQVSGAIKAMAPGSFPSVAQLAQLATQSFSFPAVLGTAGGIVLLTGLALFRKQRAAWPPSAVVLLIATLSGVGAYYITLGWLSSWPVQAWYAYPLILPVFMLALLVLQGIPRLGLLAGAASVTLVSTFLLFVEPSINAWQRADAVGRRIETWAADHPGTFAMGDLAGNTAWRLQRPFLQTEGLVMSPAFLEQIRESAPLAAVLRESGVRYYATIAVERDLEGCYLFREPLPASGVRSGMRGRYCGDPLLEGRVLELPYYVFPVDADGWVDGEGR